MVNSNDGQYGQLRTSLFGLLEVLQLHLFTFMWNQKEQDRLVSNLTDFSDN